jgi:rfaE bifunctional protein kinase chain/domain
VGWVGADEAGHLLRRLLEEAGVDTLGLLEHDAAPTVVKTRIVAGGAHTALQQVVRVDRGAPFPVTAGARREMLRALGLGARGSRCVVLSDYGYDSVTPRLARSLVPAWRRQGRVVALDSRYRLASYRDVTLATPNEGEAAAAVGRAVRDERDLAGAARRLRARLRARELIVTRGRDGLTLWEAGRSSSLEAWGGEEAVDVTGAGDAVVATASLALSVGASPLEAAALANVAGSVAVGRRGAVAVSRDDLARALRRGGRARR